MQYALERQQGCLLHQDTDIIMKVTRTLKSIFLNLKRNMDFMGHLMVFTIPTKRRRRDGRL